jgi:hypothetical protein
MIQSKPFYWITCDQEGGCSSRSPDEDYDTIAWSEEEQAIISAEDSEWITVGTKHYCPDHRDAHEAELPIEGQAPFPEAPQ